MPNKTNREGGETAAQKTARSEAQRRRRQDPAYWALELKKLKEYRKRAPWKPRTPDQRVAARKWYLNNRDLMRGRMYMRAYGIGLAEYDAMVSKRGGLCDICKTTSNKHLNIDHDHATGKIRGLLCHNCNKGLGHFKDNTKIILASIGYLNDHALVSQ